MKHRNTNHAFFYCIYFYLTIHLMSTVVITNPCLHVVCQFKVNVNLVSVASEKRLCKCVPDNVQLARSVWQEAVRMTNEDLCTRIKTASEDGHVCTQSNPESRRSAFRWNAAQVLREEAEYRCIAAGSSKEFPLWLQGHLNRNRQSTHTRDTSICMCMCIYIYIYGRV